MSHTPYISGPVKFEDAPAFVQELEIAFRPRPIGKGLNIALHCLAAVGYARHDAGSAFMLYHPEEAAAQEANIRKWLSGDVGGSAPLNPYEIELLQLTAKYLDQLRADAAPERE